MQHRTVSEVMTRMVVSARPGSSFKEIARLFHDNDITAVPVVDDEGRPLGVVSEADLLHKAASLPDPEGRLARLRLVPPDRARADAETAEGLMTSPAVTARPGWNIVETARTMDRNGVKRLPVIDETGKVVGIVSRSDLLRPFLRHDHAIHDEIRRDVLERTLGLRPGAVEASVRDGVVTLTGRVEERADIPVIERLCQSVDGVVAVHQTIGYVYDNLGLDVEPPHAGSAPRNRAGGRLPRGAEGTVRR
ncbi:CBS domain-containing protein [Streptomyces sp. HNM0663]|uniref:CBS domain-containing protein n=1 Tax=Streptomyces chengmaiensis TaxID=3040919 RepID=A0ABT6HGK7_9ACTN|nr:CBS domain-containing protein [Streptomyces chengmaiensis]MDH2387898.1 CBS domain-containing protein [Streptomyces chengmaiensis]